MSKLLAVLLVICCLCGTDAFAVGSLGLRQTRAVSLLARSPRMAMEDGDNVAVYSVFERLGITTAWHVANKSPYKGIVQLPPGFTEAKAKLKWNIDGMPAGVPEGIEACEETMPGYIKGIILATEVPAAPQEIEYVLSCFPDLEKCVMLSSVGVPERDSMLSKLNPFNKAEDWYEAEEAVRRCAAKQGFDATVVRTGDLMGGAFYYCNPDFEGALSGNVYDLTHNGFKVSKGEGLSGQCGRDLAATVLIDALRRNAPLVGVVGAEMKNGGGALESSVRNPMGIKQDGKDKGVFVPSQGDLDAAYASV